MAGLDTACGFASWVGKKSTADDEGTLVRVLRSLGATILGKTSKSELSSRCLAFKFSYEDRCASMKGTSKVLRPLPNWLPRFENSLLQN